MGSGGGLRAVVGGKQAAAVGLLLNPVFQAGFVGYNAVHQGFEDSLVGLAGEAGGFHGGGQAGEGLVGRLPHHVLLAQYGVGGEAFALLLDNRFEVLAVDAEIAEEFGYFDFVGLHGFDLIAAYDVVGTLHGFGLGGGNGEDGECGEEQGFQFHF